MTTKTKKKEKLGAGVQKSSKVSEIYVRISIGSGAKKDTLAHSASSVEEALQFINKYA